MIRQMRELSLAVIECRYAVVCGCVCVCVGDGDRRRRVDGRRSGDRGLPTDLRARAAVERAGCRTIPSRFAGDGLFFITVRLFERVNFRGYCRAT